MVIHALLLKIVFAFTSTIASLQPCTQHPTVPCIGWKPSPYCVVKGVESPVWFNDALKKRSPWPVELRGEVCRVVGYESLWDAGARNGCCSGLMQINRSWTRQLIDAGVIANGDELYDGEKNLAAGWWVFEHSAHADSNPFCPAWSTCRVAGTGGFTTG